ncbi:RNA polymerase subunit sigma [Mycobacteroides abscessus]|nr:RNA polymerase subunit sigma [Mycobacteroides abscessus]
MSAVAGTLSDVDNDPVVDRRGTPWTAEEIGELVERIRAGVGRTDVAQAHGRTPGAIDAVVWRLLPVDRRPEKKNRQVVEVLYGELDGSTDAEVDWWARYVDGRAEIKAAIPTVPKSSNTPETSKPLLESVHVFADQPVIEWGQPGQESELGPLIVQVVNEISDARNRYIMARRLGIMDGPNTLEVIGEGLGITRERVRQLQNRAIDRMQRDARRRGSAGATLSVIFGFLDKEPTAVDALAETLLGAAEELFRCNPIWLVKLVTRMGGRTSEQAEELAASVAAFRETKRRHQRELAYQLMQVATCDRIVDKWVHAAYWPPLSQDSASAHGLQRRRMPTPSGSAVVGSFTSEKTGAEIYFESLLEESVFTAAESSSRIQSYQEQPCEISYIGEDRLEHIYYPDLILTLDDGRVLLVEVKPLWQMALTSNRIKCGAGQRYAAQHGWGWVTVGSSGQSYRDLEQREISDLTRRCLAAALNEGPVSWIQLQELRTRTPITAMDVAAFAVQENAGLELFPYRLYHVSDM